MKPSVKSVVTLVWFGILAQVWSHSPNFSSHEVRLNSNCGRSFRSHFCTTNFNVLVNEKTYPTCPPNTDCVRCEPDPWWDWGWGWWRPPACPSCCNKPVVISKIVSKTKKVCCPGYYGWNCDKAFCAKPCEDPKTDCTAPNTCGPACYPPCRNGGTCISGDDGNTCLCANGWTGPTCDTAIPCDDSEENSCQNGGTCYSGRCLCTDRFRGVFCEEEICEPPCENGGQCIGQNCTCVNGFSGDFCQTPPDSEEP